MSGVVDTPINTLSYPALSAAVQRLADELAARSRDELLATTFTVQSFRSGLRRAEIGVHKEEVVPGILRIVVQGALYWLCWPSYSIAVAGFRRPADGKTLPLTSADIWEFDRFRPEAPFVTMATRPRYCLCVLALELSSLKCDI